ncbi:MAG: PilT/PilU family type 4a pilus ATPase [Deltaproteobacteria bacterium]|nr:PilT/PilU family type 4a pilus ATPase [Deltaproteobacteria bacterium]
MDKDQLIKLLTFGIQRGVSDIHFAVGHRPHYRVKGDLLAAKYAPMTPEDTIDIARVLFDDPAWEPSRMSGERDFSYSIPGIGRFRVHVFLQRGSVGIVIRVIPYDVRSFEVLNLPRVLGDIASSRRGLILVTGATGMGKSTTIAAMLKYINETRHAHVVTIEDPIEFLFGHGKCIITQREVGSDTGSYRDALVAALRQDPDVIMVGEVREQETAETCLKAAETGHMVMSAIHTTDVIRTIERFVGLFPSEMQDSVRVRFADCLTAIVSLRLLVNKSGLGLIPAVEVLRATRTVREYVRRGDRLDELHKVMEQGKDLYAMQTFDQHLLELYRAGHLKLEVGKSAASNPEDFERAVTFE